jgi:hypothetical protein
MFHPVRSLLLRAIILIIIGVVAYMLTYGALTLMLLLSSAPASWGVNVEQRFSIFSAVIATIVILVARLFLGPVKGIHSSRHTKM